MKEKDKCLRIDGPCPHKISTIKNICFIMMAYDQFYTNKIEKMLKTAITSVFKLKPVLARDLRHTRSMDMYCSKVCRPIKESTYCFVDLTYNNSNVGFEIGIAQHYEKPIIITRYIPKGKFLTEGDKAFLEKIRQKGVIQYSTVPNPIASDILAMYRVDYSTQKELIDKLKDGFVVE